MKKILFMALVLGMGTCFEGLCAGAPSTQSAAKNSLSAVAADRAQGAKTSSSLDTGKDSPIQTSTSGQALTTKPLTPTQLQQQILANEAKTKLDMIKMNEKMDKRMGSDFQRPRSGAKSQGALTPDTLFERNFAQSQSRAGESFRSSK